MNRQATMNSSEANWIAVDWGTTSLRVWAMDAGDAMMARTASDAGMGSLAPDQFQQAFPRVREQQQLRFRQVIHWPVRRQSDM